MFIRHSVLILVTTAMLTGCASLYDTDDPKSQTKRGAVIGAAIGAVAGIFVGDGEADEILASAAIGAGLGAGIGAYMDKQQRELEQIEGDTVETWPKLSEQHWATQADQNRESYHSRYQEPHRGTQNYQGDFQHPLPQRLVEDPVFLAPHRPDPSMHALPTWLASSCSLLARTKPTSRHLT